MAKAIDAATEALWQAFHELSDGSKDHAPDSMALAALRAALPVEPTDEMIDLITLAGSPMRYAQARYIYRALRAHLLGEDA